MNIEEYKKNHKTAYLAEMYEKLEKEELGLLSMSEKDFSMKVDGCTIKGTMTEKGMKVQTQGKLSSV